SVFQNNAIPMSKNLVIVESPAKAKTIEGYLGKDFTVKSSFGHIRDLPEKELGIDIEKSFEPSYVISSDKTKVVNELKQLAKTMDVWLATDDDREGEAISWHLNEALGLGNDTKRIVFREITKNAINKAIETPRTIDLNLVNAQQARRILDRLVGFQLSPVLWKKIRTGDRKNLSAGRVQSVTVRIVVEREREIEKFDSKGSFKIVANFITTTGKVFRAELSSNFEDQESTEKFLNDCIDATYKINSLEVKPASKSPAPPFTTSTLQQEASRKLGFSVLQTMTVAQRLYESGAITYMRTDSTNLSQEAMENAKNQITSAYGEEYSKPRTFKTKDKSAQEAHEAIRPTDFANLTAGSERNENRLYDLIRKRALASQMADAKLERTTVKIGISTRNEELTATGEMIKFEGFLKLYLEGTDDDGDEDNKDLLPPMAVGQNLTFADMRATERFSRPPARYTEASLVKKLEELGIGRPSTYAPTISTVIKREYIIKEDRPGFQRKYKEWILKDKNIEFSELTENYGSEKAKLFPTNLGMIVNDYLVENFEDVLNYKFTASVENEFDEIAEGSVSWQKMIQDFYGEFHTKIEKAEGDDSAKSGTSFELGIEPKSGKKLYAKVGKFGPYLQIGESTDEDKPTFVSLKKGTLISSLTYKEAMDFMNGPRLPLELGLHEELPIVVNEGRYGPYVLYNGKYFNIEKGIDPLTVTKEQAVDIINAKLSDTSGTLPREVEVNGELVTVNKGRFGPYIKVGSTYHNIPKDDDPTAISAERIQEIIENSKKAAAEKIIKEYPENKNVQVLNGRYGAYIKIGKRNVKIPKGTDPATLTLEDCIKLGEG
ncbi:MAG: type I DNA topoisomerase, partial [Leadbetterella sp.]